MVLPFTYTSGIMGTRVSEAVDLVSFFHLRFLFYPILLFRPKHSSHLEEGHLVPQMSVERVSRRNLFKTSTYHKYKRAYKERRRRRLHLARGHTQPTLLTAFLP